MKHYERKMNMKIKLLNSIQIRKMLGLTRQAFYYRKKYTNFPKPVYSQDGIELWDEVVIKNYIEKSKTK